MDFFNYFMVQKRQPKRFQVVLPNFASFPVLRGVMVSGHLTAHHVGQPQSGRPITDYRKSLTDSRVMDGIWS